MDRNSRNQILAELQLEAWKHSIKGQQLLSRIRDLETMFKAQDAKEDRKHNETRT